MVMAIKHVSICTSLNRVERYEVERVFQMNPKISVCIPAYNGSQFLRECLDSVTSQTFYDFEVLIVDDLSTDNTVDIAKEYADTDSRIKIAINTKNLGLVGNWNCTSNLLKGNGLNSFFKTIYSPPNV